jgi:hypothetical protein
VNHNNHQAGNSTNNHVRGSAADANDFLQRMKGKGPRESLGETAPTALGWAFVQATIGCIVLMAVLTVGPYLYSKNSSPAEKPAARAPEQADKPDTAKNDTKLPETPKTGDKTGGTATADNKKDKAVPSKDIVEKLKENETKGGTPKDPFGPGIDDLLDKK